MDNSTTTWIMVALLLLLIGAAIFMLLRRPGGDDAAVNHRDVSGVDAPGATGNASTDIVTEGRDLGPGTAAPEIDAPRERHDEPFDQHATTDERVAGSDAEPVVEDRAGHDPVVEDRVADEDRDGDEDRGMWREAAAVGAAGAAGAGAVAATSDEEPATADEIVESHDAQAAPGTEVDQGTEYVVREDDHEPVAADPDAAPVQEESVYDVRASEDAYAAPAEDTAYAEPTQAPVTDDTAYAEPVEPVDAPMTDDTAYAEPVEPVDAPMTDDTAYAEPVEPAQAPMTDDTAYAEPTDEDRGQWRDAAAVGAAGAAGAGAAGAGVAATQDEQVEPVAPVHEEPAQPETTWDDTFAGQQPEGQQDQAYPDSAHPADTPVATDGDVHPLSTDEIDAGARQEPLPADEQGTLPFEEVSGAPSEAPDEAAPGTHPDYSDEDRSGWRDAAAIGAAGAAGAGAAAVAGRDETRTDETQVDAAPTGDVRTGDVRTGEAADVRGEEYSVGEPTTYRAGGDDVPVDASFQEERGYHDDTTPIRDTDRVAEDTTGGFDGTAGGAAEDTTAGDTTDTEAAGAGGAVFAESVYGPGSAEPGVDGTGPTGWEIKGNSGSMLFHTPESPSYDAVRAEVWFESEETAREAGFAHWDRRRR